MKAELEVLEMIEGKALTDGTIEDNDGDDDARKTSSSSSGSSELVRRWVRIIRCGVNIAGTVDGFNWVEGSREWSVEGKLGEKERQRIKPNWKGKREEGWVGGGQKILWMLMRMKMKMFRKRVRMMKMIQRRSKL